MADQKLRDMLTDYADTKIRNAVQDPQRWMAGQYERRVADTLTAQIQAGKAPWHQRSHAGVRTLPMDASTGRDFQGGDALYLAAVGQEHGYKDRRWLTAQEVQKQGGTIRPDEQGTIVRQTHYKDGQANVAYNYYYNAQQVDGLEPDASRKGYGMFTRATAAESIINHSGTMIDKGVSGPARYHRADNRISVPEPDELGTPDNYYSTVIHELGRRPTGPQSLERGPSAGGKPLDPAQQDLRADLFSYFVGDKLGMGNQGQHLERDHASRDQQICRRIQGDPQEIFRAAGDSGRVAEGLTQSWRQHELEKVRRQGQELGMGRDW